MVFASNLRLIAIPGMFRIVWGQLSLSFACLLLAHERFGSPCCVTKPGDKVQNPQVAARLVDNLISPTLCVDVKAEVSRSPYLRIFWICRAAKAACTSSTRRGMLGSRQPFARMTGVQ